jgi:hypothetical protein
MNRRDLFRKTTAIAVTLATLPLGAKEPEFWVEWDRTELNPNNQNDQIEALTRPADHAVIKSDDLSSLFSG